MTTAPPPAPPSSTTPCVTLPSGCPMPILGLGTWKTDAKDAKPAVKAAVRMGYRHIDTAAVYENEKQIGEALKELFDEGVVKREDLFITSKVWNTSPFAETLQKSLDDLQLSYLDLYLLHMPNSYPGPTILPPLIYTWRKMEDAFDKGLAKSIGVSNFSQKKLAGLLQECRVKPHVHQFESHPVFRNDDLMKFTKDQGIHVTCYSPFGSPDSAGMMDRDPDEPQPMQLPEVLDVAKARGKTPAQVLVRYAIQRGNSTIPKSVHTERIKENMDVFGWELSNEDLAKLNSVQPQARKCTLQLVVNPEGPFKVLKDFWEE